VLPTDPKPAGQLTPAHFVLVVLLVLTLGSAVGAVLTGTINARTFHRAPAPSPGAPITVP